MVTRRDYTAEAVGAAKSVLIELVHLLGEYRNEIVLVGGWVPELLLGRGYREGPQPSIFLREVAAEDARIVVQVDFMAGEYGGTGRSRRHQRVPEIQARKARGCDLAFTAPT
jgi:hypothetical protein